MILTSVNTGTIGYEHVGYNVGGIVGRTDGLVSGCVNQGRVLGRKDVGGIAGQAEPYRELDLSKDTIKRLRSELEVLARPWSMTPPASSRTPPPASPIPSAP